MDDLSPVRTTHVEARLRGAPVAWLGSTRADGQPHLVPIWFVWEGGTLLFFAQPGSQKVRNLRRNPRATLALEGADNGEVVIVEGEADLLAERTDEIVGPTFWEKYDALLPEAGLTRDSLVAEFCQPIRLRPAKVLAW